MHPGDIDYLFKKPPCMVFFFFFPVCETSVIHQNPLKCLSEATVRLSCSLVRSFFAPTFAVSRLESPEMAQGEGKGGMEGGSRRADGHWPKMGWKNGALSARIKNITNFYPFKIMAVARCHGRRHAMELALIFHVARACIKYAYFFN